MAPKLVSDTQLMDRLIEVFRLHGFEGASLARLQEASGLKRSSLYHRFPAGKNDMANAVVAEMSHRFASDILDASSVDGSVEARIQEIGSKLSSFFEGGGGLPCLIDTLSIGSPTQEVSDLLNGAVTFWIDALAELSREAGHSHTDAQLRATDAVAAIEGALVLARTTGDRSAFERAIAALPDRLT